MGSWDGSGNHQIEIMDPIQLDESGNDGIYQKCWIHHGSGNDESALKLEPTHVPLKSSV
jgi:hypothetical protein